MINGIGWLGVRTAKYSEMLSFYRDVMHLVPAVEIPGQFVLFDLPGGDRIEVFSEQAPFNEYFPSAPVAGFLVDDVATARTSMEAAGVEFAGAGQDAGGGVAWAHFYAPDGNLYEITHRKDQASR